MIKKAIAVLAAVGCVACVAKTPASQSTAPPARSEIDRLRSEAKQLLDEQTKQRFGEWNDGIAANLPETYRGHEKLLSADTSFKLLNAINQTNDPRLGRALRFLRSWIIDQVVGRELIDLLDKIDTLEASPVTIAPEQTIPFNTLQRRLAKEVDAEKRKAVFQAALPVADQLAQLHLQFANKQREVAKNVGFANDIELADELRATDVSEAGPLAQALLNETDAMYLAALKSLSKQLVGVEASSLRPADNPRLLRQVSYDVAVSHDTVQPTVERTFAALGLELKPPFVTIDASIKPGKNPLTAAFALNLPTDVRVSFTPIAGVGPLEALLHEAALAASYAATTNPWFEFQRLGNQTVRESTAYLFRRLASNPAWVQTNLTRMSAVEQKDFVRWQAFRQLLVARRHASRILFGLAVASGQAADPAALYQNLMSRAYGYRVDETDRRYWAADHDLQFESLDYFRAWMLEAALEASLESRFGDHWFERKEAGTWLRETWASGSELMSEELLARLQLKALDITALVARFKKRLS